MPVEEGKPEAPSWMPGQTFQSFGHIVRGYVNPGCGDVIWST